VCSSYLTISYSGFYGTDNAGSAGLATSISGTQSGVVNAGSYLGNYSLSAGSVTNYTYNASSANLTVNKKALTAIVNGQTVTYGDVVPTTTVTYTGFVNGEDSSVIDTQATIASVKTGVVNAGSYLGNYTASGAFDNNYSFSSYTPGDLQVNKKALTVTAANQTITYGAVAPTSTSFSYSGFVNGEDSSVIDTLATLSPGAQSGVVNAGTYANNYNLSGALDNNYSFVYANGSLLVNKKALTATAANQTMNYGDAIPATSISYSGFYGTDDASSIGTVPSISSTQSGRVRAGSYLGNYVLSGGIATNYSFNYVSGNLLVNAGTVVDTSTVSIPNSVEKVSQNPMSIVSRPQSVELSSVSSANQSAAPSVSSTPFSTILGKSGDIASHANTNTAPPVVYISQPLAVQLGLGAGEL
jgi:hypothetical protein